MRICPVCEIKTPLMTFEMNGVRGERCIPCQKMLILETTFARALLDTNIILNQTGKTGTLCPHCGKAFYQYALRHESAFAFEMCKGCNAVWIPTGAVKAYLELESASPKMMEVLTVGEKPNAGQWLGSMLDIPELEEESHVIKRVIHVKNRSLSVIFFVIMTLAIKAPIEFFAFDSAHPWRLGGLTWITHAFLHADIYHFLANMLFYIIYSYKVEDRIGSEGFFTLFTVSAIFSVMLEVLFKFHHFVLVGASGAIFGIMMYYSLVFPGSQLVKREFDHRSYTWYASRKSVYFSMLALVIMNIFSVPDQQSHVAYLGHVGGALGGVIYYFMGKRPKYKKLEKLK